MPKFREDRRYHGDCLAISDTLVNAGYAAGLHLKAHQSNVVVLKQGFSLFTFGWPAEITATIRQAGGCVLVEYLVCNGGWGPFQTAHIKKVLGRITTALASREAPH
jgi:hypothetical protein